MSIARSTSNTVEDVDDLLVLYDQEFVTRVYEVLLCRAPDNGGLRNYLLQIRKGVSKQSIIAEIAESEEGRSRNVKLNGLNSQFLRRARKRPSVWQRVMRGLFNGIIFPTEQQLRVIENQIHRLEQSLYAQAAQLGTIAAFSRANSPESPNIQVSAINARNETSGTTLRSLTPPVRRQYLDLQAAIEVVRKDLS